MIFSWNIQNTLYRIALLSSLLYIVGCSPFNASTRDIYSDSDYNDLLFEKSLHQTKRNRLYDHGDESYAFDNDSSYRPIRHNTEIEYIDNSYTITEPATETIDTEIYYEDNDNTYITYKDNSTQYTPDQDNQLPTTGQNNTSHTPAEDHYYGSYADNDEGYVEYHDSSERNLDQKDEYYPLYSYDDQGNIVYQDGSRGVYEPFPTNNTLPYLVSPEEELENIVTDLYDYQY